MKYKWKPSASQRKAFAEKMKDPNEKLAYEISKEEKAEKRRSSSAFDYQSAGGMYIPSKLQHDYCVFDRSEANTEEQKHACDMVATGYSCNEKVHHDYIHLVNEQIRRKGVN